VGVPLLAGFARSGVFQFLSFQCNLLRQSLRRDHGIAAGKQLLHFCPVNIAPVKPQCHPTSRRNIGRKIKPVRLSVCQRLILARQHFTGDRNDAVAMMIVQKVGKCLFADQKLRMRSVNLALRFREGQSNFRETG
jgi:hypothetical protein